MTRQELAAKLRDAGVVELKHPDIDDNGAQDRGHMLQTQAGTVVTDLQEMLISSGHEIENDGFFGKATARALREFNGRFVGTQTDVFRVSDHDGATDPEPEPEHTIHPRTGFPDEHEARAAETEAEA